jgi:hypothetical protein
LAAEFAVKLYQRTPCIECPWRLDQPPGRFPPERYIVLAESAWDMAVVQFACHKSPEGQEFGCAGWVLQSSAHNYGARMAASRGVLNPAEISSPYPLYETYRALAIANGVPPDEPALVPCRDDGQIK